MTDENENWLSFISDERLRRWVVRKFTEYQLNTNDPNAPCTPQAFVELIIREYASQGIGICDSKEEEDKFIQTYQKMTQDSERSRIRDSINNELQGDVNRNWRR